MTTPAIIIPGYFARASEYQELERLLNDQGIPTITVPLRKRDWLPTVGGRSMVPILQKISGTVKKTIKHYGVSKVNLIAHSAGGWIARIYLGNQPYDIHGDLKSTEDLWGAYSYVETLVTLGTPHISQEPWTRRNLDFVKNNYPGAYYSEIRYICIAGKAVYGEKNLKNWLAYNSYQLTCGDGNSWGDGITPVKAAHLEGALNITLDGVMHAPTSPGLWYGSPQILPSWISYLQADKL